MYLAVWELDMFSKLRVLIGVMLAVCSAICVSRIPNSFVMYSLSFNQKSKLDLATENDCFGTVDSNRITVSGSR